MPKISNKGKQMPASPIRRLVPFAEKAKKEGKKIYHLNIGQPDIETPENVLNALRNFDSKVIAYSNSVGTEGLKLEIQKYYAKLKLDIKLHEMVITTGGSEALLFGFFSCFNEDDEIIIPEPYYANYNGFATAAGIKIKTVTSKIEDGFALPPIKEIEALITDKTRGILICNPGNPTGTVYTRTELEELKNIVKKHDLFLFADEVYREFCYDGLQHTSVLNFEDIHQNIVLMDSISKRYSMCGSRIGVLISKNNQVIESVTKFAQSRLSPPTLGQFLAEEAFKTPQSYIDKVIMEYKERRDLLIERLNQIPGVRSPKPTGAFYTVAELPVDDADHFCQWLLEKFDLNGETVMMAPASGFYHDPMLGRKQVRIAYVLNKSSLSKAMDCLEAGLNAYKGKGSNVANLQKQEV